MSEEIKNEKDLTFSKLNRHFGRAKVIDFDFQRNSAVIFSDHHMGNGRAPDRFKDDEMVYRTALQRYNHDDFQLILAGDVLEGYGYWGVKDIVSRYRGVFDIEKKFISRNAYHRIYGNHDRIKRYYWKKFAKSLNIYPQLGQDYYPAIKLGDRIAIAHGHQGSLDADQIKYTARLFVKLAYAIFRHVPKEGPAFSKDSTDHEVRARRDRYLFEWAKLNKYLLVAGHTHDCVFESKVVYVGDETPSEAPHNESPLTPCYFNTGSAGVYNNGITGIEIDRGSIRLVWWERDPIVKHVLRESSLEDIFQAIDNAD